MARMWGKCSESLLRRQARRGKTILIQYTVLSLKLTQFETPRVAAFARYDPILEVWSNIWNLVFVRTVSTVC
jgi:hypothetical protein